MTTIQRKYVEANTLLERVRQRTLERGANGIKGVGRLFQIADDNSNKLIDTQNELPKLINDIGLILNKTELAELIRIIDKDADGFISFDEFLFALAPPLSDSRITWIVKAFDKLDINKDGIVELEDIQAMHAPGSTTKFGKLGTTSIDAVFQNLLRSMDQDGIPTITKEEFINYYRQISPSIDTDEYFTEMMKSSWKL
uniref:EF-hand family protein n=1 Tax=Coptotermes formosanus TaxID=36987 RepID=R4UVU1_COPFO|nr:EF-hand family protein [Coptotermes formosanus]